MTAAAATKLTPEAALQAFVDRVLGCPGKDIPARLYEAHVGAAHATVERTEAEDAVRDCEYREKLARAAAAEAPGVAKAARDDLAAARDRLRSALLMERLSLGALEAVRARVDLIAASARRGEAQAVRR